MKNLLLKAYPLICLFLLMSIGSTNSYFNDSQSLLSNSISAGCWDSPSIPVLTYPSNGYTAFKDSEWDLNPYMDWSDSISCNGGAVTYQYESYHDEALTSLAYRSGWLSESMINAPGTPNGHYFWRVRASDGVDVSDWSNLSLLTVSRLEPLRSAPEDFLSGEKSDINTKELIINENSIVTTPIITSITSSVASPIPTPSPLANFNTVINNSFTNDTQEVDDPETIPNEEVEPNQISPTEEIKVQSIQCVPTQKRGNIFEINGYEN